MVAKCKQLYVLLQFVVIKIKKRFNHKSLKKEKFLPPNNLLKVDYFATVKNKIATASGLMLGSC